jgi:hypothetical protein
MLFVLVEAGRFHACPFEIPMVAEPGLSRRKADGEERGATVGIRVPKQDVGASSWKSVTKLVFISSGIVTAIPWTLSRTVPPPLVGYNEGGYYS